MQAKADLHVHSRYSNRPSEWILRRIGAPECYVDPRDIYRQARAKGMDFVTISDHNTIAGALEIADLPGVFLSAEVTTYFPEDGCKIHVLVHGITEKQFAAIDQARESIYDLREYLVREDIVHSVAHPLFAVNEKLELRHVEKLVVLFDRFETLNGTRHLEANRLLSVLLDSLTPDVIAELADTHGIAPLGEAPWMKCRIGGSDDHSGIYIASAYTVTPATQSVADFIDLLRRGQHQPGGEAGTSLQLAHGFYRIGYMYYRQRLLDSGKDSALFSSLFRRMAGESPAPSQETPLRRLGKRLLAPWRARRLNGVERQLLTEFSALFGQLQERQAAAAAETPATRSDRQTFELASRISQQIGYQFMRNFVSHLRDMSFIESLQTLASLAPVALSMAPYVAAFKTQHKDDALLAAVSTRFNVTSAGRSAPRKAWVTDTFSDINGVARTIRTLGSMACGKGHAMTVMTCLEEAPRETGLNLRNFEPVGMFDVPEYAGQRLAFPPFMEILETLERERFTEVIISTPGPMGLAALAGAKLLGLRTSGIYHTDFPKYVEVLTEDAAMAQATWRSMCWFYGQLDLIYAPSVWYRRLLEENGLGNKPIVVLPRGVDTQAFNPAHRRSGFWNAYGSNGNFKFLYVGRMAKEKNLDILLEAFDQVRQRGCHADLALVGDGPLLPKLRRQCAGRSDIILTGTLTGEPLQQSYASSDAFVFPSTTDTFGNVVLEAQASGLPAIVANAGGPPEIVRRHASGIVVDPDSPGALADAMAVLCTDASLRRRLGEQALVNARESSWESILDLFWSGGQPAVKQS